jgi:hypothetical protein
VNQLAQLRRLALRKLVSQKFLGFRYEGIGVWFGDAQPLAQVCNSDVWINGQKLPRLFNLTNFVHLPSPFWFGV